MLLSSIDLSTIYYFFLPNYRGEIKMPSKSKVKEGDIKIFMAVLFVFGMSIILATGNFFWGVAAVSGLFVLLIGIEFTVIEITGRLSKAAEDESTVGTDQPDKT
jgi:hypothetical protein